MSGIAVRPHFLISRAVKAAVGTLTTSNLDQRRGRGREAEIIIAISWLRIARKPFRVACGAVAAGGNGVRAIAEVKVTDLIGESNIL